MLVRSERQDEAGFEALPLYIYCPCKIPSSLMHVLQRSLPTLAVTMNKQE